MLWRCTFRHAQLLHDLWKRLNYRPSRSYQDAPKYCWSCNVHSWAQHYHQQFRGCYLLVDHLPNFLRNWMPQWVLWECVESCSWKNQRCSKANIEKTLALGFPLCLVLQSTSHYQVYGNEVSDQAGYHWDSRNEEKVQIFLRIEVFCHWNHQHFDCSRCTWHY